MTYHVKQDLLYGKLLRQFVINKHSFLRAYCQYSETLFEKEAERELTDTHGDLKPDRDAAGDTKAPNESFSQADEFRKTLRRSNFITAYAFWESQYKYYAEWIILTEKRDGGSASGLELGEIEGESVADRYRTILVQHIGLTDDEALWTVLDDLAVVRHQIVHGTGELSLSEIGLTATERYENAFPNHDRLIGVLNKYVDKGLSMDRPGEFLIDASLIEYLIDTTEKYMFDVITRYIEQLKERAAIG